MSSNEDTWNREFHGTKFYPIQLSSSDEGSESESDEDLDRFIRQRIGSTYHYTSTCRMAPEEERGVVDDELRVYGVQNLRIADASIFPVVPSAHPQAPVVMVAERCADFIKAARV